LRTPTFYLSEFLEANRREYYDRLLTVSEMDDWTGWCMFFLNAITVQAQTNQSRAEKILDLYQRKKSWFAEHTRSQYSLIAHDWIFGKPIFKIPDFVSSSKIPKNTAVRIVNVAREKGLLKEIVPARGRRPAILAFSELLNIAEGREVF
jgi:Fic family protein